MTFSLRHYYVKTHFSKNIVLRDVIFNVVLFLSISFCSLGPIQAESNNLGTPFITNYDKKDYAGGTQTWDIVQDEKGLLYFANNDGLLIFDGTSWDKYRLPNKTLMRSLALKGQKIYVGGQGEIGFFEPNTNGLLVYTSLLDRIPKAHRQFEDVWDILSWGEKLIFRTEEQIYILEGEKDFQVIDAPATIHMCQMIGSSLYLSFKELGLFQLINNDLVPVPATQLLNDKYIVAVNSFENGLLISTLKAGLWNLHKGKLSKWTTSAESFLQKNRIHTCNTIDEDRIAVGTDLGGILILGKNGKPIHKIDKMDGLQTNNVFSQFVDSQGQLWLGLDNGIDQIHLGLPFGKVIPDGPLEGKAYAVANFKGNIYFGTNNGLYYKPWKAYYAPLDKTPFQLVEGTQGQSWGLDIIHDQLWLGNTEGAFLIEAGKATQVWNETGIWKFIPMGEHIIMGGYQGLVGLKKNNGNWIGKAQPEPFNESARIMIKESDSKLWVSHPYRGVFRIGIDPTDLSIDDVKSYGKKEGVVNEINNYIFSIYNAILLGTEKGILVYDAESDAFRSYELYNKYLGSEDWIQRLYEDYNGNIWYIKNNIPGLLNITDNGLEKSIEQINFPDLQQDLVGGFELIYPVDQENVFIGIEKGFIHLQPNAYNPVDSNLLLFIDEVKIEDSIAYSSKYIPYQNQFNKKLHEFSKNEYRVNFKYGVINLIPGNKTLYRHRLNGLEDNWSAWNSKQEKEYTNLSHGDYIFEVQAKDELQRQSAIIHYNFNVPTPWYLSTLAWIIYALLFVAFIASLILIPRSMFEVEKAKIESAHNEVMEKTQEEIMALKTEKLEADIKFKNKELASATMHWAQKSEILQRVKTQLEKITQDKTADRETLKKLRSLVRNIESDTQLDNSWDQFALHFDEVHSNFLKKLRDSYPEIRSNDLKLCAYLKMNLSTKEIAPLLNISVRGVEASRYRLRKKLGLGKEVKLVEYLLDF